MPTMPTKTCLVLKAGNFLCRPFYRAKAESERGKKVSKDSSKASFSSSSLAEFSNAFSMSSFFPFLRSYFSFPFLFLSIKINETLNTGRLRYKTPFSGPHVIKKSETQGRVINTRYVGRDFRSYALSLVGD